MSELLDAVMADPEVYAITLTAPGLETLQRSRSEPAVRPLTLEFELSHRSGTQGPAGALKRNFFGRPMIAGDLLVGVGYIVGLNIGLVMVAGGLIAWWLFIPIYNDFLTDRKSVV